MKIALIPCGRSEWRSGGRLLGRVELSPTASAAEQYAAWSAMLRPLALTRIIHSPDELATTTAQALAQRLETTAKPLAGLVEVDVGLWAGLTDAQLKKRYASAYRQLLEAPLSVNPPSGEEFSSAVDRLESCLRKQLKRNGKGCIGLVLRPLVLALARCILEGTDVSSIWALSGRPDEPVIIESDSLTPLTAKA